MNREVIEKTREFLLANPGQYVFMTFGIPTSEDDTGCLLGWAGYFSGHISLTEVAKHVFGDEDIGEVYHRVDGDPTVQWAIDTCDAFLGDKT